ncbi:interferon-induced very large GTPase 1-like [Megalops cyprinoides]|uniref:interferon-induced very large GTPase 1-like n=1 Tax=Megalops cyprinoides TaxID=118141 RepID=UPI001864D2D0|nr:interferon-induced very large GTPase 1-like [Megalops cyprinoides]
MSLPVPCEREEGSADSDEPLKVAAPESLQEAADLKSRSYPEPGDLACDFCTGRKLRAVKYCLTCTASYCETHVRQHYTVAALQRHTLVEADGDLEHRLCQQHHRALEVFCETDQMLICSLSPGTEPQSISTVSHSTVLSNLQPGTEYTVSVCTVLENGRQSEAVSKSIYTKPSAPGRVRVQEVRSRSVRLRWDTATEMEGVSYTFSISYSCDGEEPKEVTTVSNSNTAVLSDLRPGVEYSFSVSTVLHNGSRSRPSSAKECTKTCLEELVCELELQHHLKEKLTLSEVLEISDESLTDPPIQSLASLPWCFLRRLMMMNVTARSVRCAGPQDVDSLLCGDDDDDDDDDDTVGENEVNPLDLVTALFLCSDSFLQQEMALKMSMCQFSVPLLLPNCDTQQPTLMLWAMRDIVKKFSPHSLAEQKGFVEGSITHTKLPIVSFVKLGKTSLSKSHILNQLLKYNSFIHHNMECGHVPRRISDGLVEVSWYLPSGNINSDIFPEPVAVANLRGDISAFETQFSFLCQTSAAVFVFCDDLASNSRFLKAQNVSDRLYLVCNSAGTNFKMDNVKRYASELLIQPGHILKKDRKVNDAEFVRRIRVTVNNVMKGNCKKTSIEQMSSTAHGIGIPVDEDSVHCKEAKQKADEITAGITDILQYKESQLPLQGETCKQLAKLEKEECRLKEAGDTDIELYKSELCKKKDELREEQRAHGMSDAMSRFTSALSSPREERSYFLKWLKFNLDTLSLTHLSGLRQRYMELCLNSSENRGLITDLDRQISSSSLGVEHFLREMGQLYEATSSLPENHPSRQQMQNLPRLCAQLLLDGFPVELVDGDASNIPLQWMKAVLTELHSLTQSNSKIRVVTVLGVQSSGKSTLLNTMFGVQFAVSSGRCTRGAFMLLIRLKKNFREQLGCDFLMVIDTEGLKSPELAQLADSYEHDNELATLVVGLSDITIINIAMENFTEMKDILQIVVHAFLRMKEVGKKLCCHFVHQNVADVSAHEKNLRDRQLLLKQLDEMTQAAARMEKGETMKFTDVMDYDPERNTWYIPGLWHGNPPMAPVSSGYSEAVKEFKSSMTEALKELKGTRPAHTIPEFLEWTRSLWKAVKYENFIFSFQNSLVADAYTKLCTEFNKWEWDFRKQMHYWVTKAETRVSNFGAVTLTAQHNSSLDGLLTDLKKEATVELDKEEKQILGKITEYFKRQEGHIYLVERYREEFMNSAKSLKREMQPVVVMKLELAVDLKKAMAIVEDIKKQHKTIMEENVLKLLGVCREAKTQMSDQQLEQEFEQMWKEMMEALSFRGLHRQNVGQEIYSLLRFNLKTKRGSVHEMLSEVSRLDECGEETFIVSDGHFAVKFQSDFNKNDHTRKIQVMADRLITLSRQFIADSVGTKTDFHRTYIMRLLEMIDEHLETHRNLQLTADFEASLKIHICGHAAREFQRMHDAFIRDNDPQQCLEKFKQQHSSDFMDHFHERQQCERTAEEFTIKCLEPAVREYVTRALGPDIMDELLTGNKAIKFSTRSFFQFSILNQLLTENNFDKLVQYIWHYEDFVKEWIFSQILDNFSREECSITNIESRHLREAITKIKAAVESKATRKSEEDMNICHFIQDICSNLSDILIIPNDALDAVTILNSAKTEQFSDWLLCFIENMEQSLSAEFHSNKDVRTRLTTLPFKPQHELFRRLFGCGKQCPFCMAPCEAGGESHTEHFTSMHRPQGLGRFKQTLPQELVLAFCSSCVASEMTFCSSETKGEYHPYKDYRKFYPDWRIPPDTSTQASAYWKYVFAKFNTRFAKEYEAEPAALPAEWKSITKEQAMESLEETFKRKRQEKK